MFIQINQCHLTLQRKKKDNFKHFSGGEKDQMQADNHYQGVSTRESRRACVCKPPRGLVLPAQGLRWHLVSALLLSSTGYSDHSISDIFTIVFQKYLCFSV